MNLMNYWMNRDVKFKYESPFALLLDSSEWTLSSIMKIQNYSTKYCWWGMYLLQHIVLLALIPPLLFQWIPIVLGTQKQHNRDLPLAFQFDFSSYTAPAHDGEERVSLYVSVTLRAETLPTVLTVPTVPTVPTSEGQSAVQLDERSKGYVTSD